jgi:hypothetical protein
MEPTNMSKKSAETKPTAPGMHYGELSPEGQWFWNGTGLPGDAWIPNSDNLTRVKEDAPKPTPAKTSSQLAYDWIELYLTPVTGP